MTDKMTTEKAIEMLIQAKDETFSRMKVIAFDMAIESLEKQIPKKPNKAFDNTWGTEKVVNVCPACDYYLGNHAFISVGVGKEKVIYCETCGQAIDWESDTDG